MNREDIISCVYLLTGRYPNDNALEKIQSDLDSLSKKVMDEYEDKYLKDIRKIITENDGDKPRNKKERDMLLRQVKESLREEDKRGFDKFIRMLRLYLGMLR